VVEVAVGYQDMTVFSHVQPAVERVQEGVDRKVNYKIVVYRGLRSGADVFTAVLPCRLADPAGAEYLGNSGAPAGAEIGNFHFLLLLSSPRAAKPVSPEGIAVKICGTFWIIISRKKAQSQLTFFIRFYLLFYANALANFGQNGANETNCRKVKKFLKK